ncbi:helix-turn-helix domain-containing protein [Anaerolentibacter hominis]|uniref:helix-turn-helix domain-containing protein n=1 Tax=Anaerolentibacter hominis TaxID=3079009 RepID=UPI0031B82916
MAENRYIISDASKQVDVEPHVLRYWEEELELPIARNEMGHRYYTESDIELLKNIKTLKEQGFQLKAIKILLPDLHHLEELDMQAINKLKEELNEEAAPTAEVACSEPASPAPETWDKLSQFKLMMNQLISGALQENNRALSEQVIKEMDYMFRVREEQEEQRFKRLDETIRGSQKRRKEKAVKSASKEKKGLFRKKKQKAAVAP